MTKLPPLNWLRTFESAARKLSFTHAADELSMTPAAVSKQIKNLEYKLGVVLFERLPNGLRLTDQGAAYLPIVHDSIERLAAATHELFADERANVLNIKVSLVFFMCWLAPKIEDFYRNHPGIDLRINTNIWTNDGSIEAGAELEIRYGTQAWPSLMSDRLTHDTLFPVCSPELIRHNRLEVVADLKNHSLLHVIGYQDGWAKWLSKASKKTIQAKSNRQFDTLLAAFDLAERGLGVALARSSLVQERLDNGCLVAPLTQEYATEEAFHLVYTHTNLSKPARIFRDWLRCMADQK